MAGVYINNVSVNNNNSWYWWIQESGKASVRFVGNNGTVVYGSGGNNNLGPEQRTPVAFTSRRPATRTTNSPWAC